MQGGKEGSEECQARYYVPRNGKSGPNPRAELTMCPHQWIEASREKWLFFLFLTHRSLGHSSTGPLDQVKRVTCEHGASLTRHQRCAEQVTALCAQVPSTEYIIPDLPAAMHSGGPAMAEAGGERLVKDENFVSKFCASLRDPDSFLYNITDIPRYSILVHRRKTTQL